MLQVLLFNDQKYNLKTIYSLIVIKEKATIKISQILV